VGNAADSPRQEGLGASCAWPARARRARGLLLLLHVTRGVVWYQVKNVHKAWEATGKFSVCGNKGGLVIKFDVGDTSFCFVSCHLAAHAPHLAHRNSNVSPVPHKPHAQAVPCFMPCATRRLKR